MTERFKITEEYPAINGVIFSQGVEPKVYDGEVLTLKGCLNNWVLGSVVGYALESGRNPIADYNRAIERGHETHYAMANGACITNNPDKSKQRRIIVGYGDIIVFHGLKFRIDKASNSNINLVEINDKKRI